MLTQNDRDANRGIPNRILLIKVEHEVEERADGVSANCGCDDMYHAWHHE